MADPRFFIDALAPVDATSPLQHVIVSQSDDLHHMVNVARVAPGEHIEVVTRGDWQPYRASVVSVERGVDPAVTLAGVTPLEQPGSSFSVTLAFGLAKGDKTDTIVRQAVEIGVDRIIPVMFQRSVVRLAGPKVDARRTRLQSIAEAAAKQSHQLRIPSVDAPCSLGELLAAVSEHDVVLIAWEEAGDVELSAVIGRLAHGGAEGATGGTPVLRVMLIVGPEGGIDAREVAQLVQAGAVAVSIGPSILRVDTAVAVSLGVAFDALRRVGRGGE